MKPLETNADPGAGWNPDRREVMKLLAASALLAAGVPGCKRKPERKIVSMVDSPEYQHPGETLYYASTWMEGQVPYGLKIHTVDGRPVKVEGLPDHPLNVGTSSAAMQGSILSLYDPDRLRHPLSRGVPISWADADRQVVEALREAQSVVLITRSSLGPAERALVRELQEAKPETKQFVHESVHDGLRRKTWQKIYGAGGEPVPLWDKARIILSLDSDFLGTDGSSLEAIGKVARARSADAPNDFDPPRLYAVEADLTLTGANADHRIPLRPSGTILLAKVLLDTLAGDETSLARFAAAEGLSLPLLEALAQDLAKNKGRVLVTAGPQLPEAAHAAAALLNQELGAPGNTMTWNVQPACLLVDDPGLIEAALAEGVDLLLLLGVNPVYDWPGGGFEDLLGKAEQVVAHASHPHETARISGLSLPSSHSLESWNDAEPRAGFRSICQPVIAPLFEARQEAESLLRWIKAIAPDRPNLASCEDWHDYLKQQWMQGPLAGLPEPEEAWDETLRSGFRGSWNPSDFPSLDQAAARKMVEAIAPPADRTGSELELVLSPHPELLDGRFSNISWLQELPHPISRLVWDNAAVIAPATARELNLKEGDLAKIEKGPVSLIAPVLIQPGAATGALSLSLGQGRQAGGAVCRGVGVNAAKLLDKNPDAAGSPWLGRVRLSGTMEGKSYSLVRTQKHFSMEGRPLVLHGNLEEFRRSPDFARRRLHVPPLKQIHSEWDYSQGHKWAMAVDLSRCVGCGACVAACQAENNIPVVGKEECALGREMHWIRIDAYLDGDLDRPRLRWQPMLCQQCDNAPCESVCPVNASAHSPEGLNEQVYNRCVGTRYCANNCPYKVRRFNFFDYPKRLLTDSVQELAFNPQVTVRSRGVMEKCTFCVQRINAAKFRAKNQGKAIPDGAIRPACQQACPAGAIVFGDANDPESRLNRLRSSPLAYRVLEELNVRPNVHYLARVENPNPAAPAGPEAEGKG